jgi:predicted DNA-binding protein (UPF0251 family)
MPRPFICRRISCKPRTDYFKPRGVPISSLEEVNLSMDEFEAIRLADLECLYQEKAAEKMKISRQTFGNIINSAHKKIAEALIKAKALKIEGGVYSMAGMKKFRCYDCDYIWEIPYGTDRPQNCPQCKNTNIHRDKGYARWCGSRRGRG